LTLAGIEGVRTDQAKLTFAMARHAAVDLAQVVNARYDPQAYERLTSEEQKRMRETLAANGLRLRSDDYADEKLAKMRLLYEPYVQSIARNLLITLPPWILAEKKKDNWQGGPWDKIIQAKGLGAPVRVTDDHF
jgi:hypothetical protein